MATARTTASPPQLARETFRHGDLRQALLDAGLELARKGGPHAVVLREATRRAGVAPNAAYRHYANQQALVRAVRHACLAKVGHAFEAALAKLPEAGSPDELAGARLRAVGKAYMHFALGEPGWYRTAFCTPNDLAEQTAEKQGRKGRTPFEILCDVMDDHVSAGRLEAGNRPNAEFLVWSAMHGLALFFIDGPLNDMPRPQMMGLSERMLTLIEHGIL